MSFKNLILRTSFVFLASFFVLNTVAQEIEEVISEAVKICSQYNWHDEVSMRWALERTKDFLEENFNLENKNDK